MRLVRFFKDKTGPSQQPIRPMLLAEGGLDCSRDLVDGSHAVHRLEQAPPRIVGDQRRGLFRKEYEGATLRENLGLPYPANRHAAARDQRDAV